MLWYAICCASGLLALCFGSRESEVRSQWGGFTVLCLLRGGGVFWGVVLWFGCG